MKDPVRMMPEEKYPRLSSSFHMCVYVCVHIHIYTDTQTHPHRYTYIHTNKRREIESRQAGLEV